MVKANKARDTVKAVGLSILFYFYKKATTSSKKGAAAREVPYRYKTPKIGQFGPTEPY